MEYLFTFLEGIASFISPCLLPMIPIYIAYFTGKNEENNKPIKNAISFVLGFTIIFIIFSVFASFFGKIISSNMKYIKIIFGIIIILLGLNYMDLLNIKFLSKIKTLKINMENMTSIKSFLFGIIFSISWTPCIGTFLSSALLLVAKGQNIIKGILLMILYSIGLGIPFILSVILIEKMKNIFNIIKNNFDKIKKFSGIILIFMGLYTIFF